MRIKNICSQCGYLSLINYKDGKCPVCNGSMIKIKFFEGYRLWYMSGTYEDIENNIIGHKIEDKYIQMRTEYAKKQLETEKERQRKEEEQRGLQHLNKYLSFLKEAEEQGIPHNRADEIALYAMQHNMYSLPHCPCCNSVDTSKISTGTKVAKIAVFGVLGAMSNAGKTWKCNNCGSKF